MTNWKQKTWALFKVLTTVVAGLILIVMALDYFTLKKSPVMILGDKFVHVTGWSSGFVSINGTWEIEGEPSAYPLQVSHIDCVRNLGVCNEARAYITNGYLSVSLDSYEIASWDDRFITYKDSPICFDYIYTISREMKDISGVRQPKANIATIPGCADYSGKALHLRLSKQFDVWIADQKKATPLWAGGIALTLLLVWAGFRIWQIFRGRDS